MTLTPEAEAEIERIETKLANWFLWQIDRRHPTVGQVSPPDTIRAAMIWAWAHPEHDPTKYRPCPNCGEPNVHRCKVEVNI